jgi:hypothetical protein
MFRNLIVALVVALLVFPFISPEVHAQEPDGEDYNLSMSGALINDWCTRNWQDTDFITVHACNYSLAQRYTLEVSEAEFASCAVANGGDIVKIADCLFARFGEWIAEQDI